MKDIEARVVENRCLGGNHYLIRLRGEFPASQPGQFLMVQVSPSFDPFLRRPFAIMDQERDELLVYYTVVGRGTWLLSEKKPGEPLEVITPLGRPFKIEREGAALFAGGRGAAPLHYLARFLKEPVIYYAGRSAGELALADFLKKRAGQLVLITEDGSVGKKGLLTDHIPEQPYRAAYVVGPEAMMRAFARRYRGKNVQYSFEERMGCGFGVCFGCAVRVKRDGKEIYVRACREGPVFSGEELVWT